MKELKTLKDLQKDLEWKYDTFMALRAEAIKWYKLYVEDARFADEFRDEKVIRADAKCELLKEFFNLSEEDLK